MRRLRACPVCPECGSTKFRRLMDEETGRGKNGAVIVECVKCSKRIKI